MDVQPNFAQKSICACRVRIAVLARKCNYLCSVLNAFFVQFSTNRCLKHILLIFEMIVDATQHCASSAEGVDWNCEALASFLCNGTWI